MNFIKNLKLNKVEDAGSGGMPIPPTPPVTPAAQPPAAATPPAEPSGEEPDHNFGYDKTPAEGDKDKKEGTPPKAGTPPPEAPVTKIADVKEPGTGYNEEPPKVEEIVAPVAPATPPAEQDEFDKVLTEIPKEDAKVIKDFATENKIPPEVAKKWADQVKVNIAAVAVQRANMERQAEQQKSVQRKSWHDELKADPKFGGANFQANVVRAEKVLSEFGPDLKKQLTEGKGMLPPNVMRMLASLADKLYATDNLVSGDPPPKQEDEAVVDRVKDFYS